MSTLGSRFSPTSSAIKPVRPVLKARADRAGTNPDCDRASSIRVLAAVETPGREFSARETVDFDNPVIAAMSLIVNGRVFAASTGSLVTPTG